MPELLSICIPTYNRAGYLDKLLEGLIGELEETPEAARLTRLFVSDNASTDRTSDVVAHYGSRWPITYHRNPVNIGGDRNFALMINRAEGEYFWLLGDDELIVPDFLTSLLRVLQTGKHHLILLEAITEGGERYGFTVPEEPTLFENYSKFVAYYWIAYPWKLMLHSFISMMVVRRLSFDCDMQRRKLKTVDRHYAHMYGVVQGVAASGGSIYLQRQAAVRIRDHRALVDTPLLRLAHLWRRYYHWLAATFGHSDLRRVGDGFFTWRQRRQFAIERLKTALGRGPKILR